MNVSGLARDDHLDAVKRDGVFAYIKEFLPEKRPPNPHLKRCLILEVCINNKKGYPISLHRCPD